MCLFTEIGEEIDGVIGDANCKAFVGNCNNGDILLGGNHSGIHDPDHGAWAGDALIEAGFLEKKEEKQHQANNHSEGSCHFDDGGKKRCRLTGGAA